MSNLFLPPCPHTCAGSVQAVKFNECAPEVHWGEIARLFVTDLSFAGFTDVSDAGEWTTNLDQNADNKIREMIVIGEQPEPETAEVGISGDRKVTGYKTFTLNLEVDETNDTNYMFMQMSECGGKYKIWYETSDGMLYGGNEGIEASIIMNQVIPRERTEVVKFMTRVEWKSLHHPARCKSQVPEGTTSE